LIDIIFYPIIIIDILPRKKIYYHHY